MSEQADARQASGGWGLGTSWLICAVAYAVALAAAWATIRYAPIAHPIWKAAAADAVATCVIFLSSMVVRNSSMYDPYWSLAPLPIALYWYFGYAEPGVSSLRVLLVMILIGWWAVRLTVNWLGGWEGLNHEDWRYVRLREQTGIFWWPVSFSGIHMFPTVLVFLGCLPVWAAVTIPGRPFGWLDIVATIVTGGAIAIEMISDMQLAAFRKRRKPGELMQDGLWAYSRHPNYFGEIAFWCGLALFGLAAAPSLYWPLSGAISMILLFVFISIPMIEKKMLRSRPHYKELQERISMVIPLPPKKAAPSQDNS